MGCAGEFTAFESDGLDAVEFIRRTSEDGVELRNDKLEALKRDSWIAPPM